MMRVGARLIWLTAASMVVVLTGGAARATAATNAYAVKVVAADRSGTAPHVDANLVNPWGLAASSGSPWWVANAGTNTTSLYAADGTPNALIVSNPGTPAGIVFNNTSGFAAAGAQTLFIFANRDATIRAWAPAFGTSVATAANGFGSHTGLAIDPAASGPLLVVANFGDGSVDTYNSEYGLFFAGLFVDPTLPSGYAPYNVQNLGGTIFIAYAQRSSGGAVVPGAGHGIVAAFGTDGQFQRVVANAGGPLNAPWGMAMAPASFGAFAGDLLVANSGNGQIHAYRWTGTAYKHAGVLRDAGGAALKIPGLHGIAFGNGGTAGPTGRLYFTAGPGKGAHGQLGFVKPA
jgi:uncharacterized protein (TIGR03118 family)